MSHAAEKKPNIAALDDSYTYVPIYADPSNTFKSEIIGWRLTPHIPQWLPMNYPPRVLDHYHLQFYVCTFNNERMTLFWPAGSWSNVLARMERAYDCTKPPSP